MENFETGKAPANSPQITTIPPQIHHTKTTFSPPFFQNPLQKRENSLKEKIALLV
jgi:hypothetical protein